MARYRTVKPEFWTSEQVIECSTNARLMFIGMWNFADDAGRLPLSLKSIKAQIFPSDDISLDTIRRMIDELSTNRLVDIYVVDDKEYLQITGWHHQKIDRPQPCKYQAPPAIPENHSTNDRRTFAPEEKGKEEKEKKEHCPVAKATRTRQVYSEEFETNFWQPYPRSPTMSKTETWKTWSKLSPDDRSKACQAIAPYRQFLKTKPNLETVHACRFLSQRRFEGFSDVAPPAEVFDIRSHIA